MNNLVKKILILSLIVGCNKKKNSEPFIPSVISSVKNIKPPVYSVKVKAVKVIGRDFFILKDNIKLKFSSDIKDQNKKPRIIFSIKQGKGNLYYTLKGSSGTRRKLNVKKQIDFEQNALWGYEPSYSGPHKLVFNITTDKGAKIQADVCFQVEDLVLDMLCLKESIKNNNIKKIKKLLAAGFNITTKDDDGNTAVHYLIENNCSDDILNALIKAEADFSIQNNDDYYKQTPLHNGRKCKKWKLLEDAVIKLLEI